MRNVNFFHFFYPPIFVLHPDSLHAGTAIREHFIIRLHRTTAQNEIIDVSNSIIKFYRVPIEFELAGVPIFVVPSRQMNYSAASSGVSQRTVIMDAASGGELDWSPVSGDPSPMNLDPRPV
jgi:hypothetical protein